MESGSLFFFVIIRRPPRSTQGSSSAASDVYKRQRQERQSQGKHTGRGPPADRHGGGEETDQHAEQPPWRQGTHAGTAGPVHDGQDAEGQPRAQAGERGQR